MEGIAACLRISSLQVLKCIDRFDFGKVFRKPLNAGFGLAILSFLDELRDLVLTERAIGDGIAFQQRYLNLVLAGEQKRLPLLFASLLDCQFVLGMLCTNQPREFLEGWEIGRASCRE